jgi:hypothetical protein
VKRAAFDVEHAGKLLFSAKGAALQSGAWGNAPGFDKSQKTVLKARFNCGRLISSLFQPGIAFDERYLCAWEHTLT